MTSALIPVPFHGDTITCIETPDGEFVAVKPICERLGLAWQTQHRKLTANPRWGVTILMIPSAGGAQEMTCIPVTKVFGWLGTITANRVKPEVRPMLERYQAEADMVLDRHFRKRAAETSARIDELEKMQWHSHQQLKDARPKWARAFMLMEVGSSDYMIDKRCGWTSSEGAEERRMMRSCGFNPKWREDMTTFADQVWDLQWKLDRKTRQGDLFPDQYGAGA